MSAAELGQQFVKFAIKHRTLKPRSANRAYLQVISIWEELMRRGPVGEQILINLAGHPMDEVAAWAAMFVLDIDSAQAVPVLARIASQPRGALSLYAEITLSEWRAGRLRFS
jgi:hypothetical protein